MLFKERKQTDVASGMQGLAEISIIKIFANNRLVPKKEADPMGRPLNRFQSANLNGWTSYVDDEQSIQKRQDQAVQLMLAQE